MPKNKTNSPTGSIAKLLQKADKEILDKQVHRKPYGTPCRIDQLKRDAQGKIVSIRIHSWCWTGWVTPSRLSADWKVCGEET